MINSVRNTVIAILNKNNYGYISPSDFNLYAQQAQLELFMKYFSDYNAIINKENARGSGTDYADFGKSFAEQMEEFIVTNSLTNTSVTTALSNVYKLPSLLTTGDEEYMINKVLCYSPCLNTPELKIREKKLGNVNQTLAMILYLLSIMSKHEVSLFTGFNVT